jgi:nucleoside-diphosphate-sugar epimerase
MTWSNRRSGSAKSCQPDLQASPPAVFITGATGFIGRRLVAGLLQRGFHVRAMIRPGKTADERLPDACEQVPGDLFDAHTIASAAAGCGAAVYCAGSVRGRTAADFNAANVGGVKAMRKALQSLQDAPPLLLISSLAASRPELSDYARSKREGEEVLRGSSGLPWTIIRPPAVYGPGDREMLPVLKMVRRGLLAHAGPAGQKLSLLHVDDLVEAVLSWLSAPDACLRQTYAIDDGTAGGYTWKAIGEAVGAGRFLEFGVPGFVLQGAARLNLLFSSLLGYAPMLSPGKVRELVQPEWLCDNTAFTRATGWQPRLNLQRGARKLFEPGGR